MGKDKCNCPPPAPVWLTTFSDLNNLLTTMFIALFSMATISPGKFQQAASSLASAFNGQPMGVLVGGKTISEEPLITSNPGVKENLLKIQMDENFKGMITIEETDRGTIIHIKDYAFFETGSAQLTKKAKELLYLISTIILEHTSNDIEVYGYTDERAVLSTSVYPSNWHLSNARAASVAYFITGELKDRRLVELVGQIKSGQFDINYFYEPTRFFPIGRGDADILKEMDELKVVNDNRRDILSLDFQKGSMTAQELKDKLASIDKEYEAAKEKLREDYRRVDLLILRQRVR